MKLKGLVVLMIVVAVGLFMVAGCSKDQPAATSSADSDHGHDQDAHAENDADHDADHDSHEGHDHDGQGHAEEATAKYANTKCPIMGSVIKPEKVTASLVKEYKGQKVAFCCAGCPDKWDALSDEDKATKLLASK